MGNIPAVQTQSSFTEGGTQGLPYLGTTLLLKQQSACFKVSKRRNNVARSEQCRPFKCLQVKRGCEDTGEYLPSSHNKEILK